MSLVCKPAFYRKASAGSRECPEGFS